MAVMRKKVTIRYLDADNGKQVTSTTPGAIRKEIESSKYYAIGLPGVKREIPLARDKGRSERMFRELLKQSEDKKVGLTDKEPALPEKPQTFEELLLEWKQSIIDSGSSELQARQQHSRASAVFSGCRFDSIGEISASSVQTYLASRQGNRKSGGISARTRNGHLQACKQFCQWALDQSPTLLKANPLEKLKPITTATDRRHDREPLSIAELDKLIQTTGQSSKTRCKLSGPARRMLYLMAAFTGLRAGTLAKLSVRNVDLVNGLIHVPASAMKAKRATRKPLHSVLRAELPGWLEGRETEELLWPGRWLKKAAPKILCRDLADAGIPYKLTGHDGITRYRDFHSLRHGLATNLAAIGVAPKAAQGLLDHSDIRLTMNTYANHQDAAGMASELDRLPAPASCRTDQAEQIEQADQAEHVKTMKAMMQGFLLLQAVLAGIGVKLQTR